MQGWSLCGFKPPWPVQQLLMHAVSAHAPFGYSLDSPPFTTIWLSWSPFWGLVGIFPSHLISEKLPINSQSHILGLDHYSVITVCYFLLQVSTDRLLVAP